MVINADKEDPDYVFPYGMIWGFKEYGSFFEGDQAPNESEIIFEKGDQIVAGAPSEEYLPIYVREI